MFKVNDKNTRTAPMAYFTPYSSVSIVNFEHVFAGWVFTVHFTSQISNLTAFFAHSLDIWNHNISTSFFQRRKGWAIVQEFLLNILGYSFHKRLSPFSATHTHTHTQEAPRHWLVNTIIQYKLYLRRTFLLYIFLRFYKLLQEKILDPGSIVLALFRIGVSKIHPFPPISVLELLEWK